MQILQSDYPYGGLVRNGKSNKLIFPFSILNSLLHSSYEKLVVKFYRISVMILLTGFKKDFTVINKFR